MVVPCKICGQISKSSDKQVRGGEILQLYSCQDCNFEFFSHNPEEKLFNDQLDHSRLEGAGLVIPEIQEDYNNGLEQSYNYTKEFLDESDIGKNILEIGCSWGYFLILLEIMAVNLMVSK